MKYSSLAVEGTTNIFAVILTAIQTNEIFQLISLILTCISISISIIYTIAKWYKSAKADGKITEDEIKDGIEKVVDEIEKAKDKINKKGE